MCIHKEGQTELPLNCLYRMDILSTGSLLVGRTADDTVKLSRTVEKLSEAGLGAKFLSSNDLLVEEPALMVGKEGGAAFLPADFQLDARLMVACIEKGHLLVIENFKCFKLNHGLMEVGYVDHEAATLQPSASNSGPIYHAQTPSISMTATRDTSGNLVLGSSCQLAGFGTEVEESILNSIWEWAGEFFPALKEISLIDYSKSREVRVGLRPYMPDGKSVIGPVAGLSNLFLATGHEGEGLTLALATAEMVADMVLGNPLKVDHVPFAVQEWAKTPNLIED